MNPKKIALNPFSQNFHLSCCSVFPLCLHCVSVGHKQFLISNALQITALLESVYLRSYVEYIVSMSALLQFVVSTDCSY